MKNDVAKQLLDIDNFNSIEVNAADAIPKLKKLLKTIQEQLFESFEKGINVDALVHARSSITDQILTRIWEHYFSNEKDIALLAVGGYGREELHPYSDIDILLLFKVDEIQAHQSQIESFLTFLWDIGLEIGSSVRTITECVNEAQNDITIATNIIESRKICGSNAAYAAFEIATSPSLIWSSKDFFEAKCQEQRRRHQRFHDTAYNLEPNIKESPGGLRDLHMIGWITKRHFNDKRGFRKKI